MALHLAQQQAQQQGIRLETAVYDLAYPQFPPHFFDVIVNIRFLERATFAAYRQSLKPGGWLFFESLLKEEPSKEYPSHYLNFGELRRTFQDYVLKYTDVVRTPNGRVFEQLVGQKPL